MKQTDSPLAASPPPEGRPVLVRSVPIELYKVIKIAGLSESGGQAKQLIAEGGVRLNGSVELQKGKQLAVGDRVQVGEETIVVQLG